MFSHCHVILFLFFLCFGLFYPQFFHFEGSLYAWRQKNWLLLRDMGEMEFWLPEFKLTFLKLFAAKETLSQFCFFFFSHLTKSPSAGMYSWKLKTWNLILEHCHSPLISVKFPQHILGDDDDVFRRHILSQEAKPASGQHERHESRVRKPTSKSET